MLKLVLLSHLTGERSEHELPPGVWTVGGDETDALRVPGLPPAALQIEPHRSGMIAHLQRVEARAGLLALPRGERRLIRRGESLAIGDHELRVEALAQGSGPEGAALVWLNGRDCGKRALLPAGPTLVGRGERCAARVRDAKASRLHVTLVLSNGEARATDEGSRNGLQINGVAVEGEQRLFGGEILTLGTTDLAFEAALPRAAARKALARPCDEWASVTLELPQARGFLAGACAFRRRSAVVLAALCLAALALAAWLQSRG